MDGMVPLKPWPSRASNLKVPYLAASTYQPYGSFYDFPKHHGLDRTDDAAVLASRFPTAASLSSFMQSWLFFELISGFLGFPVDHSDFITDEGEGFVNLDQAAVHDHFRAWKKRLWRLPYARKRQVQRNLEELIDFALSRGDLFEEAAALLRHEDDDFDLVALSIKLLASILAAVLEDTYSLSSGAWAPWARNTFRTIKGLVSGTMFYSRNQDQLWINYAPDVVAERKELKHSHAQQRLFLPLQPGDHDGGRGTARLIKLLQDNGWCPFRARQLCRTYDFLTVNSLAAIKRPVVSVENHQNCIRLGRCSAHDVNVEPNSAYPFRHDCGGTCGFEGFSYDAVANIVRQGGIPVASVNMEGPLDLRIHRCTAHTTYTAVSHVWSDGLGNPNANALPICQLERLRDQIRQTYAPEASPFYDDTNPVPSLTRWEISRYFRARPHFSFHPTRVFFWMDTLCIPVHSGSVESEAAKELRFRAIKQITPIFAGAFNALVLDSGLQAVTGMNPTEICGDEFASLILGSKWMERGWTLEEGCLAQSCVFHMLGKPYDMNTANKHLLPEFEPGHSPLQRTFVQNRRSTASLLRKSLLDSKKHVWVEPLKMRAARLSKLLRIPQFVWTWNSLINRATTRPEDGIIILANLLDFNIYALRLIPKKERLMSVIQSCNELPLSLLYNTGPRTVLDGHPELGWIPRDVVGDSLVLGGIMRRIEPRGEGGPLRYLIQRPDDGKRERLLVLTMPPGQFIPHEACTFSVRGFNGRDYEHPSFEYVIEVQTPASSRVSTDGQNARQAGPRPLGTCLMIDLAYGTRRRRGYAGRGARFSVDGGHERRHMSLTYDAPVIAWTGEQWLRKTKQASIPDVCFDMITVPSKRRMVLECGTPPRRSTLSQRPMFTQHPPHATIVGLIIYLTVLITVMLAIGSLFIAIRSALGFKQGPSPVAPIVLQVFGPVLAKFLYDPIRRRLAMFSYVSWLKTFAEEPGGSEEPPGRRRKTRAFGSLHGLLARLGRRSRRGVTQISVRVPSRGAGPVAALLARVGQGLRGGVTQTSVCGVPLRGMGPTAERDEFPGEVFLE